MVPAKKSLKGFVITYVLIFGIFSSSYSQQARVAIVGGVNESTVIQTSNQPNFSNYKKGYSPRVGFHIGLLADFPLSPKSKFYFQPAIEFFNKGRKFAQTTKNGVGDTAVYQTNNTQFLNYIDVPLNIVYKFELAKNLAFMVGAGPYISFFYNGKESSTTLGPNNYYSSTGTNSNLPTGSGPGQYRTLDYGMNALAGIYLGGSFITANFSRGLQNAYQDSTYSGTFKNQVVSLTLGVYLGERKKKKPENKIDSTDTDNDGVIDKIDFCPTVPGLKKYNGCPIPDTDKDSINDEEDKCPTIAGVRRYNGCPVPDTDSDGVNDEEDKCLTAKGLPQYKGCPIPIDETLAADSIIGDTMIYYIYYEPNKVAINVKGAVTITKIHNLLKANKNLNIKISGYSDRSNNKKIALQQSASRAIIARNRLKDNKILPSRMKVYHWGSSKASAQHTDKTEQWKDRRVEIAVYVKTKKTKPVANNRGAINNVEKDTVDINPADTSRTTNADIKKHNKNVDNIVVDTNNFYKNNQQTVANNNPIDTSINADNSNQAIYNNNKIENLRLVKNNNQQIDTATSANQMDSIDTNKSSNKNKTISDSAIIDNDLIQTNLTGNKRTDKEIADSSVNNNPADSNNLAAGINNINSKKIIASKNKSTSDKSLVSRSARNTNTNTDITIDTSGIDQTITKKGPFQIDDTDKVLDCYTIYFDPNESILNSASFDILDHIRGILKADSTLYIGIYGYSERIGSESSAQRLSKERAFLTRDYMNSYSVSIDRMRVSYWGSKMPVADNNDPYQQWENRRVEICIYIYPK